MLLARFVVIVAAFVAIATPVEITTTARSSTWTPTASKADTGFQDARRCVATPSYSLQIPMPLQVMFGGVEASDVFDEAAVVLTTSSFSSLSTTTGSDAFASSIDASGSFLLSPKVVAFMQTITFDDAANPEAIMVLNVSLSSDDFDFNSVVSSWSVVNVTWNAPSPNIAARGLEWYDMVRQPPTPHSTWWHLISVRLPESARHTAVVGWLHRSAISPLVDSAVTFIVEFGCPNTTTVAVAANATTTQLSVVVFIPVRGERQLLNAARLATRAAQIAGMFIAVLSTPSTVSVLGRVMATRSIASCDASALSATAGGGLIDFGLTSLCSDNNADADADHDATQDEARSAIVSNLVVLVVMMMIALALCCYGLRCGACAAAGKTPHGGGGPACCLFVLLSATCALLPSTASASATLLMSVAQQGINKQGDRCTTVDVALVVLGGVSIVAPVVSVLAVWRSKCSGAFPAWVCTYTPDRSDAEKSVRCAPSHRWKWTTTSRREPLPHPIHPGNGSSPRQSGSPIDRRVWWCGCIGHRFGWYIAFDFLLQMCVSVLAVASGMNHIVDDQCVALSAAIVALLAVQCSAVVLTRPFTSQINNVYTTACLLLIVAAATIQVVFVALTKESSSKATRPPILLILISTACLLCVVAVSVIKLLCIDLPELTLMLRTATHRDDDDNDDATAPPRNSRRLVETDEDGPSSRCHTNDFDIPTSAGHGNTTLSLCAGDLCHGNRGNLMSSAAQWDSMLLFHHGSAAAADNTLAVDGLAGLLAPATHANELSCAWSRSDSDAVNQFESAFWDASTRLSASHERSGSDVSSSDEGRASEFAFGGLTSEWNPRTAALHEHVMIRNPMMSSRTISL
jgi:hypothetical protein